METARKVSRQRLHQLRFPERAAARQLVNEAVQRGKIPAARQLACVRCGQPAAEYHHWRGYGFEDWLNVVPVCRPCHATYPDAPAKQRVLYAEERGKPSGFRVNRLSRLMGERRLSIRRVARETGIPHRTIALLWHDWPVPVDAETLDKLCGYFGVGPGAVFEWVPDGQERQGARDDVD